MDATPSPHHHHGQTREGRAWSRGFGQKRDEGCRVFDVRGLSKILRAMHAEKTAERHFAYDPSPFRHEQRPSVSHGVGRLATAVPCLDHGYGIPAGRDTVPIADHVAGTRLLRPPKFLPCGNAKRI